MMILSHKDLARELNALERKSESHDMHIRPLFDAIRELHDTARVEETEDRVSGEGTSSTVRKRISRHFYLFGIPKTWKCLTRSWSTGLGKDRLTLISTFREFSKRGSSARNENEHGGLEG